MASSLPDPQHQPTIVSAPGKVLLAGGYLVLDRHNQGTVVATSARFYTIIRKLPSGQSSQIVVRSPQFLNATWAYTVNYHHKGAVSLRPELTNATSNKFVQLALERVLFLAAEVKDGHAQIRSITESGLEIIVAGDNDFYSQQAQLSLMGLTATYASLEKLPKFAPVHSDLENVHKTGLGSSAALIASLTAALMLHFKLVTSLGDPGNESLSEQRAFVHNVAQYIHCAAQAKVGSGFDISSAMYGSQLYKRFEPGYLHGLIHNLPNSLTHALRDNPNPWTQEVLPFKLPPFTRLMLGDVDAGFPTTSAVSKVLNWQKTDSDRAKSLWETLGAFNDSFAGALVELSNLHKQNPGAYERAVASLIGKPSDQWALEKDDKGKVQHVDPVVRNFAQVYYDSQGIRANMRLMGKLSNVEIEPEAQTILLDSSIEISGVIAGGVPGAGGYDAIWLLVLDYPKAPKQPKDLVAERWGLFDKVKSKVSPLLCSESTERGVRIEGNEVLDWLKNAKYI